MKKKLKKKMGKFLKPLKNREEVMQRNWKEFQMRQINIILLEFLRNVRKTK